MSHRIETAQLVEQRVGQLVDLAEFARVRWWAGSEAHDLRVCEIQPDADGVLRAGWDAEAGEWHVGLEWLEPRDVRKVVVRYTDGSRVPPDLRVQYWRNHWPTPAPERRPGAGRGWIKCDDPWHGQWTTVRGKKIVEGARCSFTFDPIDLPELGGCDAALQLIEAEHFLARFRRTLKLRIVSGGDAQPLITGLNAYSASSWRVGHVEVWFGLKVTLAGDWSGTAKVFNGQILGVEELECVAADMVENKVSWTCHVDDRARGIRLHVLYADCDASSADRTVVTVHTKTKSFSFLVSDLNRGPIYVQDYGVFINWADSPIDVSAHLAELASAPKSIYDRVADEPEQSLARALAEIPPLSVTKHDSYGGLGRYVPLGVEAGRQEFALRYNGELFADKLRLNLMGRDGAQLLWPGHYLRYRFGCGDPPDFRERRDGTHQSLSNGWLPVVFSRWLDREIEYEQTAFAALLDGPTTDQFARRGDENIVAMLRFAIRNSSQGQKRARLWLVIEPQEEIELLGVQVVALGRVVPAEPVARQWRVDPYEGRPLRCVINTAGRGALSAVAFADGAGKSHSITTAVAYDVELAGGEEHTITITVPFVSLMRQEEWKQVADLDFDTKLDDVSGYWREYIESGAQIDVPDQVLADFFKAVRTHVAISVDKDPVDGLYVVPAATWSYGACGNEACWQITMLDQAGHHGRAEAYLETFLCTQGAFKLDGQFAQADGALQGLDIDGGVPVRGGFGYNLDHGVIMECLAHHFRITCDRSWLVRAAPKLVAACDFVVRERESTKTYELDGRPVAEWGLLPAGRLEDNPEWRHWFAVNAHAYRGMRAIADILAELAHPEAERLGREAAAYREDIRAAARRAMVEAPLVRLLDRTYIPHIPTRTGIRGRESGWFRSAAYGALHLLEGDVFDPDEEEMTWVLKDLEDNLFVSREWGRPTDLERDWFSHGGATIQPNLMDIGVDYLRRGQIEHGLRALFNNFGTSLYPDVRVFAEHPVVELGHGVGPFFKSSDEAKALVWLRAFLLREEGESLHLAMGAPRAWFTPGQSFGVQRMPSFFGPVSYRIESGQAELAVELELGEQRPPRELLVHLRRPERQQMQMVTVNGAAHTEFDPARETVRIAAPQAKVEIRATYA